MSKRKSTDGTNRTPSKYKSRRKTNREESDEDGPSEDEGHSLKKKLFNEPSSNLAKVVIYTKGFQVDRNTKLDSTAL